jgi:hypothetical protein
VHLAKVRFVRTLSEENEYKKGTNSQNPCKKWSQWPGLNRRPTVYETVALPLSYIGLMRRGTSGRPARFERYPF